MSSPGTSKTPTVPFFKHQPEVLCGLLFTQGEAVHWLLGKHFTGCVLPVQMIDRLLFVEEGLSGKSIQSLSGRL